MKLVYEKSGVTLLILALIFGVLLVAEPGYAAQADEDEKDVKYSTKYFMIHTGGVALNPYLIKDNSTTDANGVKTPVFDIEDRGDTDTAFFIEATSRARHAWLGEKCGILGNTGDQFCVDGDARVGFVVGAADKKDEIAAAVVQGAGDGYMELSGGVPLFGSNGSDSEIIWTFNLEGIGGAVTSKGAQSVNVYYGGGFTVVSGIPFTTTYGDDEIKRRIEFLTGVYYGQVDTPVLLSDADTSVDSSHGYPKFTADDTLIFRSDIHFPVGRNGYMTVKARYFNKTNEDNIEPWTVSFGVTVPIANMFGSLFD